MSRCTPPPADSPLQRELRRLSWALVLYGILVFGLALWAVRLGLTHRRFEPVTVFPVADSPAESVEAGQGDPAPDLRQVRGEVP
jgi:hypothetical protein